jgi:hypothetical protein
MSASQIAEHGHPIPAGRRGEAGLSLVEVLIAGALLLGTVAILPLFMRAMVDNVSGSEYTQATNFGRTSVEVVNSGAFDSEDLTLDAGTEKVTREIYYPYVDGAAGEWYLDGAEAPAGARATWERTTTVRQFNIGDIINDAEDEQAFSEPLDAAALPGFVHLKEITVEVRSSREAGLLGFPKSIVLRRYKAF